MEAPLPDAETFLSAMARRYVWDQSEAEALASPDRIICRVMDLGTIDDAFDLEPPCEALKALTYFEGSDLAALTKNERALLVARSEKVRKPKALKIASRSLGL